MRNSLKLVKIYQMKRPKRVLFCILLFKMKTWKMRSWKHKMPRFKLTCSKKFLEILMSNSRKFSKMLLLKTQSILLRGLNWHH